MSDDKTLKIFESVKVRRRPDGLWERVGEGEPYDAELLDACDDPCTHPISATVATGLITCPRCGQLRTPDLFLRMPDLFAALEAEPGPLRVETTPGIAVRAEDDGESLADAVERMRATMTPAMRRAFDRGRQAYRDSEAARFAVESIERDLTDRRGLKSEWRMIERENVEVLDEIRTQWRTFVLAAIRMSRGES